MSVAHESYPDPKTAAVYRRVELEDAMREVCSEYDRIQQEVNAATLLRIQGGPDAQLPNIDAPGLARITLQRLVLMEEVMQADAEMRGLGLSKQAIVAEIQAAHAEYEGHIPRSIYPDDQRIVDAFLPKISPDLSFERPLLKPAATMTLVDGAA